MYSLPPNAQLHCRSVLSGCGMRNVVMDNKGRRLYARRLAGGGMELCAVGGGMSTLMRAMSLHGDNEPRKYRKHKRGGGMTALRRALRK